ncbi:6-bladed beta-propeller [Gracilimonas tropica]|uniref:6-bladed beta-propeller n=1 Tax=Gracilimonas tropica TaxID=454600 RepID=UPI00038298D7|nr:6-bladed beta-propeller [Gracilimonas tropica]
MKDRLHNLRSLILILILISTGCDSQTSEKKLPLHVQELENLQIFTPNQGLKPNIELTRQSIYKGGDKLIIGSLLNFEVDNNGNVYLADWEQKQIHVFNGEGDYLKSLGNEGVGPGEFQTFSEMNISGDSLHVFDRMQFKINTFELNEITFANTTTIRQYPKNSEEHKEVMGWIPMYVTPRYDGTSLVGFLKHPRDSRINRDTYNIGEVRKVKYYFMDYKRNIISDKLFELRDHEDLAVTVKGKHYTSMRSQPYLGKSLVTDPSRNKFITNWTEDFLLKIYNKEGNYERAIYYPVYKRRALKREDLLTYLEEEDWNRPVVEHAELPEKWPIIYSVNIDENGCIWVLTINDGDRMLQWLVLNENGKIIGKANLPEELSLEWLMEKPKIAIKNGSLYTNEIDPKNGADRLVRYISDIL